MASNYQLRQHLTCQYIRQHRAEQPPHHSIATVRGDTNSNFPFSPTPSISTSVQHIATSRSRALPPHRRQLNLSPHHACIETRCNKWFVVLSNLHHTAGDTQQKHMGMQDGAHATVGAVLLGGRILFPRIRAAVGSRQLESGE